MSKNLGFFIEKDKKLIPFKLYIEKFGDDSCFYHYLAREEEREKLCNRWRVLHYCGKKFIANEGTRDEIEVTPNDIVVLPFAVNWARLGQICSLSFAVSLILFLGNLLFHFSKNSFMDWMNVGMGISSIFVFIFIVTYVNYIDNRSDAKTWNDLKIPEDKLV